MAKDQGFNLTSNVIIKPKLTGSYQDILTYREELIKARNAVKELEKAYENLYRAQNTSNLDEFTNELYTINGINAIVVKTKDYDNEVLKDIIDKLSSKYDNSVVFIANVNNGKIVFIAKSKGNNIMCGNLVKQAAIITGGNGGGRPDFAQAGGREVTKLDEAILKVKELIK